jgi:histone H1/5
MTIVPTAATSAKPGPSTASLLLNVLKKLDVDRKGVSLPSIKKSLAADYDFDVVGKKFYVKKALAGLVLNGDVAQIKGSGMTGRFKLGPKSKEAAKKAVKAGKTGAEPKPAAKKLVSKKPTSVKATPKKVALKKASLKKATPKKVALKKSSLSTPKPKKAAPKVIAKKTPAKKVKAAPKAMVAKKPAVKKAAAKKVAAMA